MNRSLASARDALLSGLFGDARQADHARPSFALDMLSDWLPYRVYDEGPGLYRNAHSKGFVLEVTPLIGADERTGEILGQFFSESLPQGACLQVLNFASPRIGAIVGPWFGPRYEQGGIYEAIAKARTNRLYDLVWHSGSAHAPFHARHVRLVLSLGVPVRDGIYVLRSDDALVVKRIAIKPGGRQITIASDNPAYPTWHDMDRSEVHVVGRVIWFGRAL